MSTSMKKSQIDKDFARKSALRGYSQGGAVRPPANGLLQGGILGRRGEAIDAAVAGRESPPPPAPMQPGMSQRDFTSPIGAQRAPRGMPPPEMPRRQGLRDGGMVAGYGNGGMAMLRPKMRPKMYGGGGEVDGPGGPREDKVPAMLSDGEYVLPAKTVKAIGGPAQLDQLVRRTNDGREPGAEMVEGAPGLARGGYVDGTTGQWVPEPPKITGPDAGPTMGQRAAGAAGAAFDGLRGMAGRAAGAVGDAFSAAGDRIRPAAQAAADGVRAAGAAVSGATPASVGEAVGGAGRAAADAMQQRAGSAASAARDFSAGLRQGAGIPQSAAGIDVADATMDDYKRVQAGGDPDIRDAQARAAQARAANPTRLGPGGVGGQPPMPPSTPPTAGASPAGGPGRLGTALRTAGRVAAPIALAAQVPDTFATPTEDYADRLSQVTGVDMRGRVGDAGLTGLVTDSLLRAGGTAYDMANSATFGLADKLTGVQRGRTAPVAAPAAAAAAATEPAQTLAATPGSFTPAARPGTVQAQNVAQSSLSSEMRGVNAPDTVDRGNQGLRRLAGSEGALAAFNNQQVANQTGITGERDANGRMLFTGAGRGPTVAEADANRQNNIAGMERSIAAMRGLREAREEAVNPAGRGFGGTAAPFVPPGSGFAPRVDRNFMPAGARQQLIAQQNNDAAAARQGAVNAVQSRGQDLTAATALRGQGVQMRGQDRSAEASRYSSDASAAASRYGVDAGVDNNIRTNQTQREGNLLTDRRAAASGARAADDKQYERFSERAKASFFTDDGKGGRTPDLDMTNRFMDFVNASGVPIARLDSESGLSQAKRAFEISERFNKEQGRSFTGRQSNSPLRPAGVGESSLTDVADGGLSLRDYVWSNLPGTNPNVVRDAGGRAALAGQVFDGGNQNDDMDLLRQFFAQRGQ